MMLTQNYGKLAAEVTHDFFINGNWMSEDYI